MNVVDTSNGRLLTAALRAPRRRCAAASAAITRDHVFLCVRRAGRDRDHASRAAQLARRQSAAGYLRAVLDGALAWPAYRRKRHRAAEILGELLNELMANARPGAALRISKVVSRELP